MCQDSFDLAKHGPVREESDTSSPISPSPCSPNSVISDYLQDSSASPRAEQSRCDHPSSLHLTTVTWDSVKEISFPEGEHFDIVDGLLIWVPMAHGTTLHQQVLTGLVILVVQLPSFYATSSVDLEVASLNNTSTTILKSSDKDVNRRGPDVVVLRDHYASDSSESSSDSKLSPQKEKYVFRTKERPPFAVIEVTSDSTRISDLTCKWIQYAPTGIRFYYIIDFSYYKRSGVACVIVGSLEAFDNASKCYHGSPTELVPPWQPPDVAKNALYHKNVYRGEDIINVSMFKGLTLKPIQCMDPASLKGIFRHLKYKRNAHNRKRETVSEASFVSGKAGSSASLQKAVTSITTSQTPEKGSPSRSRSRSPPLSPEKKRSRSQYKESK